MRRARLSAVLRNGPGGQPEIAEAAPITDPAFDWGRIHTKEQWDHLVAERDSHAAAVVEKEVLARGRRALLIFGGAHLMREQLHHGVWHEATNLTGILEKRHPGVMFLIWSHSGSSGMISEVAPQVASWPKPSLALLKGTWLGTTEVDKPGVSSRPRISHIMEELVDALLYLGPVASVSTPPDEIYSDSAYLRELLRRDNINGGLDREELRRLSDRFLKKKRRHAPD